MRMLCLLFCSAVLAACSSTSKKQEDRSAHIFQRYEKKMRDLAGVTSKADLNNAKENPHLQNVDLTIVGPDGDVILFYKDGDKIVIQECESYTVVGQRGDCKPKSRARTASVAEFKSRLKAALRVENFDALSSDKKEKLADYREGLKQTSTAEDLNRQRNDADAKVKKLKAFIDAYGADNAKPGELAELESKLTALNTKVSQGQKFSDAVVEINQLIDRLVDQVIGGTSMATYKYSTDKAGIEYSVLRTYVRPYLAQAAFVPVKSGTFKMGSPEGETGRYSYEILHSVTLTKDYEIGATEVTQLQWVVVMGSNPSYFKEEKYCPDSYTEINGVGLCAELPVERVSWNEVQDFVSEYNKRAKDGYTYRLPTEAEWEYAARAGTSTAYSFGDDPYALKDYGWYYENSSNQTHSVATKVANAWGVYDMHGNVWEWVQDWYQESSNRSVTDPTGPSSDSRRVVRGGGWNLSARDLRSANRSSSSPGLRYVDLGFRLVRTPK